MRVLPAPPPPACLGRPLRAWRVSPNPPNPRGRTQRSAVAPPTPPVYLRMMRKLPPPASARMHGVTRTAHQASDHTSSVSVDARVAHRAVRCLQNLRPFPLSWNGLLVIRDAKPHPHIALLVDVSAGRLLGSRREEEHGAGYNTCSSQCSARLRVPRGWARQML